MDPNPVQPEPIKPESAEDRAKTFARRALIQAGWAVPALAVFALPSSAGAASGHFDSGGVVFGPPGSHADISPHHDISGGHNDGINHFDFISGDPHNDSNAAHLDNGVSVPPHSDS